MPPRSVDLNHFDQSCQTSEALFETRELLHLITNSLPVLVSFVSSDRRYRFVNKRYQEWLGLPSEAVVGKQMEEVLGSNVYLRLLPYVDGALSGQPLTFEGTLPYKTLGNREVRIHYVPQARADGKIDGFVGIVTDVTESKEAERRTQFLADISALLSSSLDYQTTLKTVAHLAVPLLADWCVVEMAEGEMGGAPLAAAHQDPKMLEVALEFRKRYPPRQDAPTGAPHVIRTGKPELYEEITDQMLVLGSRDEEELRFARELKLRSAIVAPIKTRRGVVGALTLITDGEGRRFTSKDLPFVEHIASRAALAIENAILYSEAQDAIRKRDDFLSIASHELKTPLTSLDLHVSGLLRWVEQGQPGSSPAEKWADKIRKVGAQSQRLGKLIGELLDVSRITAGRLELDRSDVDLVALAEEVVGRFQDPSDQSPERIKIEGPVSLIGDWDRNRLDQVLTNLISNALKYGQGKPVAIEIENTAQEAHLKIRDQGIGISSDDQLRIFERFERAVPSRNYGGIGLGLWICRQIVEAHGGNIGVVSSPGNGSTFVIELPKRSTQDV